MFNPIITYPKLKRVTVGLASRKATEEIHAKLGKRAVNLFGAKDGKTVLK